VTHAFPRKALGAGMLLTLGLFVTGGFGTWTLNEGIRSLATTEFRLKSLTNEIVYLDEVLTMSARMAAATGESRWKKRYDDHVPRLDAAIKETIALAPEAYLSEQALATEAANAKLVANETLAFALVKARRLDEASELLFSTDYETQKGIYAAGMALVSLDIEGRAKQQVAQKRRIALLALSLAIVLVAGLAVAWTTLVVLIRRYLRAQSVAEAALLKANATLEQRVTERTELLSVANENLRAEMSQRERVEQQLLKAAETALRNARAAGMAEVATGVLHNVGNALNSVNVSVSLVADKLRQTRLPGLSKATRLLRENQGDLSTFLASDPRGQQLPVYLESLAAQLDQEYAALLREVDTLKSGVKHITTIVCAQQSFAKTGDRALSTESVNPATLFEEAIVLALGGSPTGDLSLMTDFPDLGPMSLDRHRLIQILVNLVRNAAQALLTAPSEQRRIELSLQGDDERVRFTVRDHGVGIAPETMVKIFSHGFTTRRGGHGFGLHASACAAMEMGGSLGCLSDGLGRGSTFFIDLPLARRAEAA
jgi:C4-dicarboxylate-specific signal transduction histidine kinase